MLTVKAPSKYEIEASEAIADHGMRVTYGPFWTLKIEEAARFDSWMRAEARAGILFWDKCQAEPDFSYMDTIKEIV